MDGLTIPILAEAMARFLPRECSASLRFDLRAHHLTAKRACACAWERLAGLRFASVHWGASQCGLRGSLSEAVALTCRRFMTIARRSR